MGPLLLSLVLRVVAAPPAQVQNNTFNSTFQVPQSVAQQYNINSTLLTSANVALDYEMSNWANGSVSQDSFYDVPLNAADAAPGALLKVQIDANTSAYTLPPNTALSRIMFMSENMNGSSVPASAYVLWPYTPRRVDDGLANVGFAHGACGIFGNCAPSHLRNLWYHFEVPFALALAGYVVVAPDYQGLGGQKHANGTLIQNLFLANPSEANDLIYALQAARLAFLSLSPRFVTMGHSQGGGAAWAVAHRQAARPTEGYLGTIAASPVTRAIDQAAEIVKDRISGTAAQIGYGLASLFPEFNISSVLTQEGIDRLSFLKEVEGCNAVTSELFASADLPSMIKENWTSVPEMLAFQDLTSNGGTRPFVGPMLVIQGLADPAVAPNMTIQAADEACAAFPDQSLQLVTYQGVGHTPVCYASRTLWLDWIWARYMGQSVQKGCQKQTEQSLWPYERYQYETNWFLEYATQNYELA